MIDVYKEASSRIFQQQGKSIAIMPDSGYFIETGLEDTVETRMTLKYEKSPVASVA